MIVLRRIIFLAYFKAMRIISRTGIARVLLPLKARKFLGQLLRSAVCKVVTLDLSRPYDVMGHHMYLDPRSESARDIAFGTYEHDTVQIFQKLVKPGMTVIDVGAHVGFYTLLAARLVGTNGRVYAFEPNPEVYNILVRNIQINGYREIVRAVPKGVSNEKRTVSLYVSRERSDEASFYSQESADNTCIEVETVSLDEFFADEGWPKVDLVKIDVEGAEVEVLEGMRELTRRSKDLKLIVEFNPKNQIRACGSHTKLFETMVALGLKRFYAIRHGLKEIALPDDVKELIRMAEATPTKCVNLLCEV